MATITATWNSGSGSWFNGASWDEANPNPPPPLLHYVPGADNDAYVPDQSGVGTPFTITYNGAGTVNTLTGAPNATLDMTGGALTILNGGTPFGSVNVSSGAELSVAGGTFSFNNGNLAGTLSGAGTLRLVNGTFNVNPGVNVSVDTWLLTYQVGSGTVSTTNLNTDLTYAKNFQLLDVFGNYPILNLNSHTLTLSGTSLLDGIINGSGTVVVSGSGTNTARVAGGATILVTGALQQTNYVGLDGKLQIAAGATYTITAASPIADTGSPVIVNDGTFRDTGAGTSIVSGDFTNNAALEAGAGAELVLNAGKQMLNGTVSGAGQLTFGFAHDVTLNTSALTVASLLIQGGNGGGTTKLAKSLSYDGNFTYNHTGSFDLNGFTFTLGGSSVFTGGVIDGAGTLKITGSASLGGNVGLGYQGTAMTLENAGAITQAGSFSLNGTILNDAGHTYTIATASDISATDGGATVTNAGLFQDTAGGTSRVNGAFNNSGTISVAAGAELVLQGGKQVLGGTVSGAGQLTFGFAHDTTLNTAELSVGAITVNGGNGGGTVRLAKDLAYAGTFNFIDQFGTFDLNGHTFTLTGASTFTGGGVVDGKGTLKIAGAASLGNNIGLGYGGTAMTLENAGAITQAGSFSLNGKLVNDKGKTYTIGTAGDISKTGAGATVTNNGTFADKAAGTSRINADFVNNGTLTVAAGAELVLAAGKETLKGKVSGGGQLTFGFAHDATLNTAELSVKTITVNGGNGGGTVRLAKDLAYAGTLNFTDQFGTFDLDGHSLKVSGTSKWVAGNLDGAGTLVNTGKAEIGGLSVSFGGTTATVENAGSMTQNAAVSLAGRIVNDAGKTYRLVSGDIYGEKGTVLNSGTFVKSGAGTATISTAFTNKGDVAVEKGTLVFTNLSNSGVIEGVLTKDGARVTVSADKGNDRTFNGGSGDNAINGGGGKDRLDGGGGADTLNGGVGDDRLTGGAGVDKLTGGAGKDVFLFKSLNESGATAKEQDTVFDFAKGDRFDLSALDADAKQSGNQTFSFIGSADFHGKAGELHFEKKSSDTYVYADVDGDGKADFGFHLDDAVSLAKADFLL